MEDTDNHSRHGDPSSLGMNGPWVVHDPSGTLPCVVFVQLFMQQRNETI